MNLKKRCVKYITMSKQKKAELVKTFNVTVNDLVRKLELRATDEVYRGRISRLKKLIGLMRDTRSVDCLLVYSDGLFTEYGAAFKTRDERYLQTRAIRNEYVAKYGSIPSTYEFIFDLIDYMVELYNQSSQEEKDLLYLDVMVLYETNRLHRTM
jgi:hypothetical protein